MPFTQFPPGGMLCKTIGEYNNKEINIITVRVPGISIMEGIHQVFVTASLLPLPAPPICYHSSALHFCKSPFQECYVNALHSM